MQMNTDVHGLQNEDDQDDWKRGGARQKIYLDSKPDESCIRVRVWTRKEIFTA